MLRCRVWGLGDGPCGVNYICDEYAVGSGVWGLPVRDEPDRAHENTDIDPEDDDEDGK